MKYEEIATIVQSILIQHFKIPPKQFSWETPLEILHKDFKILSYLVFLEQLLFQQFGQQIPLLENFSTAFHTPRDLVRLISANVSAD